MLTDSKTTKHSTTDVADALLARLAESTPGTDQYTTLLDQLEKLQKIKTLEKENGSSKLETLLPVVGNLAGILAILNFERAGVVTSKALSFVTKSR